VVEMTQLALPHLEKTKGNIINVSSVGAVKVFQDFAFYTSLKAALDHFTRNYAALYGEKGVRINCLKYVFGLFNINFGYLYQISVLAP